MSVKTPVTILQELTIKNASCPHFEYLDKSSNNHFQCQVTALDVSVIGEGRCKKDAKQEAARLLLRKLAEKGKYFPKASDNLSVPNITPQAQDVLLTSVASLTDFCVNFRMPPPEFTLLADVGPPHAKQFTMQCKVGNLERVATAISKKQAKQLAANIILEYFKQNMDDKVTEFMENMATTTTNMDDDALAKYLELSGSQWRPNLGFIIADYHYGLKEIEENILKEAKNFYSALSLEVNSSSNCVADVEKLLGILGLEYAWEHIECNDRSILVLLKVLHAIPPAFIDGSSTSMESAKMQAASKALLYFKRMLSFT